MKKIVIALSFCSFVLLPFNKAQAELPPKVKVLLLTSTYGTVAGALLGTASLAFKAKGRAVAQGASLGLYAGIIFGTYVIVSHGKKNEPVYEQAPVQDINNDSPYGGGGGGSDDYYGGGIFDGNKERLLTQNQKGSQLPPLYLNLANFTF